MSVRPVLDPQTAARLDQMGTFTSVEVTLPVNRASLLSDDPSAVAAAMREMAAASLSKTLHVKAVIQGSGPDSVGSRSVAWLCRIGGRQPPSRRVPEAAGPRSS